MTWKNIIDLASVEQAFRERKKIHYNVRKKLTLFDDLCGQPRKHGTKPYYEVCCMVNNDFIKLACAVRNLWYLNIRDYHNEVVSSFQSLIRRVADKIVECQNEDTLRSKVRKETGILI